MRKENCHRSSAATTVTLNIFLELGVKEGRAVLDNALGLQPASCAPWEPTIGLTVGVFDLLHHGHFTFLRAAREHCDMLFVGLQLNPMALKPVQLQHSYCQRLKRLALLQAIDRIVAYQDVDDLVRQLHFDRLILGEDQQHPGFCRAVAQCHRRGISVVRLPRTPEISSTALRLGLPGRFKAADPPAA